MSQALVEALDPALRAALERLAGVPELLVATDYDGVLAPIVENPDLAVPLPAAVTALGALAALPRTKVAVISGRALRDLARLAQLPTEVHLVGSHGAEFDIGFGQRLPPPMVELRNRLLAELQATVTDRPGVRLEIKPASIAVHTRTAAREVAAEVIETVCRGPATWPGVSVTHGKEVVELAVATNKDKGTALETLRTQLSADAVLFMGDDVTDESAFKVLRAPDVGIKIGPGDTAAQYRVTEPVDAVAVLTLLLDARRPHAVGRRNQS